MDDDSVGHYPRGAPLLILRAEGAALALGAVAAFAALGGSWWLFAILILAPDLSILAYLAGPRIGAYAYNAVHSTAPPILLAATGWTSGSAPAMSVALIWLAHVGIDRMLGYGLKYADGFGRTHLGRIGRR